MLGLQGPTNCPPEPSRADQSFFKFVYCSNKAGRHKNDVELDVIQSQCLDKVTVIRKKVYKLNLI